MKERVTGKASPRGHVWGEKGQHGGGEGWSGQAAARVGPRRALCVCVGGVEVRKRPSGLQTGVRGRGQRRGSQAMGRL